MNGIEKSLKGSYLSKYIFDIYQEKMANLE